MPIIKSLRKKHNPKENENVSYSPPLKITGGDKVYTAGGYTVHMFLTPGPHQLKIEPVKDLPKEMMGLIVDRTLEVLMVGAGGAGGGYSGGGGGGEVLYISRNVGTGTFPLNVAPATSGDNGAWSAAKCGTGTTGFGETAKGGGSGRASDDSIPANPYTPVANGGAGSSRTAGYFGQQGTSVGTGVTRHGGFRGGQENSPANDAPNYPGHGGGGAGQSITGNTGGGGNGGAGGSGVSYSLTGTALFWGGGGGGQTYYGGQGGAGGAGGGAAGSGGNGGNSGGSGLNPGGSTNAASSGASGGANTGGGGGSGNGQNGSTGGGGGSGVVIVRYPT
jgi:hypothetical protein